MDSNGQPHGLFLRDGRWPVVVGDRKVFRYEGTWPWTVKGLPSDTLAWLEDFTMDQAGLIHIAALWGNLDYVREYVESGDGWVYYSYHDSYIWIDGQPFVSITTKADTSFMFYEVLDPGLVKLTRMETLWEREVIPTGSVAFSPDAQVDSSGNLWFFYHKAYSAWCAHQDSGSWVQELVEDIGTRCWYNSGPFLTIRGTAFALYRATGAMKSGDDTLRFAWRRPDGTWYYEKLRGFSVHGVGVDAGGLVHGLAAFKEDSFAHHVVRDTASLKWDTLEVVDSVNGTVPLDTLNGWCGGYMLVDVDGFLHATYMGKNGQLCYATTRPDVMVSEALSEPVPKLILIPASHGFWITGHSGPVQIYDPAGRIVLSKEIKGKTLIGPMRPGVYFVVAGRQRGQAVVR